MTTDFSQRQAKLRTALGYSARIQITDVGANPMNFDAPYKELHEDGSVDITGFDPQADTLKSLQDASGKKDRYLPYAIGDGEAHELNLYKGSGLTSLLKIRRPTLFFLMGLKRAAKPTGTETLETRRLDDLEEVAQIDLLKIDIQGAEMMVFENAGAKMKSAVAVHSEVNFFPLYEDQPSFGQIDVELRRHGFVPHSFYHTVKRLVRSRYLRDLKNPEPQHLLDGDIIYFRDLSRAAEITSEQLCKLAIISDGIYGFFDYTLRCLDELESRGEVTSDAISAYLDCLNA